MKSLFISIVALVVSLTASADTAAGYYKGDINNDNEVNILDVALLVNVMKGNDTATKPCYLDDDDDIDLDDLDILTDMILNNKKVWVETEAIIPSAGSNDSDDAPKIVESKGANLNLSK